MSAVELGEKNQVIAESIAIVDCKSNSMLDDFATAMQKIGFAVLINHPLQENMIADVYAAWEDFFQSPEAEKQLFAFKQDTHDGYVPAEMAETAKGATVKDLKQFYHFFSWGRCPAELRAKTLSLFSAIEALACHLLTGLERHLPASIIQHLDRPLADMVRNCKRSLLRPIQYPPLTGAEEAGAVRAAAHEDICMLTLIPRATSPGLQVLSKQQRWLNVPCDPRYVVVNIGDCLQECTQGFYPSTTHRVINPETASRRAPARMSMPLFLHAHDDVVLSTEHTAESYRRQRFKELGLLD